MYDNSLHIPQYPEQKELYGDNSMYLKNSINNNRNSVMMMSRKTFDLDHDHQTEDNDDDRNRTISSEDDLYEWQQYLFKNNTIDNNNEEQHCCDVGCNGGDHNKTVMIAASSCRNAVVNPFSVRTTLHDNKKKIGHEQVKQQQQQMNKERITTTLNQFDDDDDDTI